MKTSYSSFAVFFILFSFSILFVSCSQESAITSPNENDATSMAKSAVIPMSSTIGHIDHSTDTVITLPKSKVTVVIKKDFPAKRIANMDDYYATHDISSNTPTTQTIQPNYQYCANVTTQSWVLLQQYRTLSPYKMGIWVTPDVISYTKAYNQYGFNELAVQPGEISTALGINFKADSLMMLLPNNQLPIAVADIQNNTKVGYYFLDEPYENNVPQSDIDALTTVLQNYQQNLKLIISDWWWPWLNACNVLRGGGNNSTISNYLTSSISGIMCDQYVGNCSNDMKAFWNEYRNTYHSVHSYMNWANNSGGNAGIWPACFDWMNGNGITNVWLYASETGNESVIQQWCALAWQKFWQLREQGYLVQVWQNTDGTCDWTNGQWQLVSSNYTQFSWTYY